MKKFLKNTIIGGIFFLIPFVIATAIFGKAFKITKSISVPLSQALGADTVKDVVTVNLITILCIVIICFLAGLFSQNILGKQLFNFLDSLFGQFIPGYTVFKNMTSELNVNKSASLLKTVLVRFDDQSQIAFEVERTTNQQVVVFLPGSPDPRSGSVAVVDSDRVTTINASFLTVSGIMKRFGRNIHLLLEE